MKIFYQLLFILSVTVAFLQGCRLPTVRIFEESEDDSSNSGLSQEDSDEDTSIKLKILSQLLKRVEKKSDNSPIIPDSNGTVTFSKSDVNIQIECHSINKKSIDFQYIDEEVQAIHGENSGSVKRSGNNFRISIGFAFMNGTSFGQFYCKHIHNPCGYVEVLVTSDNKQSTFQIIEHYSDTIPPLKRRLGTSPNKSADTLNSNCPFEFFVKLDKSNDLMANCTVNYLNNGKFVGTVESTPVGYPVVVESLLRNSVTHKACLTILETKEDCVNCEYMMELQPTILKCSYNNYNAHQFVFFDIKNDFHSQKIYKSWSEVNPKDMIDIYVPEEIYEGDDPSFRCIFSDLMFSSGYKSSVKIKDHGWMHIDASNGNTDPMRKVTSFGMGLGEGKIKAADLEELKCIGPVWNSSAFVSISRKLVIHELRAPYFVNDDEDIYFTDGDVDKKVICVTYPPNKKTTYAWTSKNPLTLKSTPANNGSALVFDYVYKKVQGEYTCTANNQNGKASKTFRVHVQGEYSESVTTPHTLLPPIKQESQNQFNIWLLLAIFLGIMIIMMFALGFMMKYFTRRFYYNSSGQTQITQMSSITMDKTPATMSTRETLPHENEPLNYSTLNESVGIWKSPQPFTLLSPDPIGIGSFASVYKVKHVVLGKLFAIKRINIYSALQKVDWDFRRVLREMQNLAEIDNPNVIKFYNCWIEGPSGLINDYSPENYLFHEWTKTETYTIFVQTDLCDGTLQDWLKRNVSIESRIGDQNISQMFLQILNGLRGIHENNIIHRDIKPNNIFYKVENGIYTWKIGDLGLSKHVLNALDCLTTRTGSKMYQSPEMIDGCDDYDFKTDIFSLGLAFFEIIHPCDDHSKRMREFDSIRSWKERIMDPTKLMEMFGIPKIFDKEANLISKMICKNSGDRIDIKGKDVEQILLRRDLNVKSI